MDHTELTSHRHTLFESIEGKLDTLYHATRSIRYADEMREYVLVVLSLMCEYLEIFGRNFQVKRHFQSPIETSDALIDRKIGQAWASVLGQIWIEEDSIRRWSGEYARRHLWKLFETILRIECILSGKNYDIEYSARFCEVWTAFFIVPRHRKSWWWRSSYWWDSWLWTPIIQWSWRHRARYEYTCISCPEQIYPWDLYEREIIRMGDTTITLRRHTNCPHDPNDPLWKKEEQEWWYNTWELKWAA